MLLKLTRFFQNRVNFMPAFVQLFYLPLNSCVYLYIGCYTFAKIINVISTKYAKHCLIFLDLLVSESYKYNMLLNHQFITIYFVYHLSKQFFHKRAEFRREKFLCFLYFLSSSHEGPYT